MTTPTNYKPAHLISISGILFMTLGVLLHSGVKEYYFTYFILPAILCPILILSFSANTFIRDWCYAFILIGLFWVSAELFWNYQDRPWLSPEPTYEGQYGWFSFENTLKSRAFPVLGGIATVIGTLIKLIKSKSGGKNDTI